MKLKEIEKLISNKLNTEQFISTDISLNGVQIGDLEQDIKKVALVVDASLESFKQAKRWGANLIFCHHGLFWGKPIPIKGIHYNRVKYLIKNNIALIASHLPLDSDLTLGNNAGLAKYLDLVDCEPFGKYKSKTIGIKGKLKKPLGLNQINNLLVGPHEPVYIVPGGKEQVETVAIVSGGSPYSVLEAIDQDIDLFITGDKSHEVYHTCIEEGINMISLGHYATETLGVKQVGEWLKQEFELETEFFDIPTGA